MEKEINTLITSLNSDDAETRKFAQLYIMNKYDKIINVRLLNAMINSLKLDKEALFEKTFTHITTDTGLDIIIEKDPLYD